MLIFLIPKDLTRKILLKIKKRAMFIFLSRVYSQFSKCYTCVRMARMSLEMRQICDINVDNFFSHLKRQNAMVGDGENRNGRF